MLVCRRQPRAARTIVLCPNGSRAPPSRDHRLGRGNAPHQAVDPGPRYPDLQTATRRMRADLDRRPAVPRISCASAGRQLA